MFLSHARGPLVDVDAESIGRYTMRDRHNSQRGGCTLNPEPWLDCGNLSLFCTGVLGSKEVLQAREDSHDKDGMKYLSPEEDGSKVIT